MVQIQSIISSNIYREDDKPLCKSHFPAADSAKDTDWSACRSPRKPRPDRDQLSEFRAVSVCQVVLQA